MKNLGKTKLLLLVYVLIISAGTNAQAQLSTRLSAEQWADSVMESLRPERKIAQLFMVAAYSNRGPEHAYELSKLVEDQGIGGLIFFQGGPVRQAKIHNHLQHLSKVPLWVAMDAEWGLGMRLDSTQNFPYQMTLGAVQDTQLIYAMGTEIAKQFKRMGMHINFAPVADVNNNPNNPVINYRSFGENKREVAYRAALYMKGMQDQGLITSIKHFPGHGDTDTDSHYALPLIAHPAKRLDSLELFPFKYLIAKGATGTMVAHLNIPALEPGDKLPSTLSRAIVTQKLKQELGFKGLVFTDALNMQAVARQYPPGIVDVKALLAGNDVLLFSQNVPQAILEIQKALAENKITWEEIEARCKKVLLAKYRVFSAVPKLVKTPTLAQDLQTINGKMLIRKLSAASLTLPINARNLVPLQRLDTLKIALISISGKPTRFDSVATKYASAKLFRVSPKATATQIKSLMSQLKNYNLVLLSVHEPNSRPTLNINFSEAVVSLMENCLEGKNTLLVWMRNPYLLNKIKGAEKSAALLLAYQDHPVAQELCAQLIFGAIGAQGKLPVTVNSHLKAGMGLTTKGGLRMGMSFPEMKGIPGDKLRRNMDSLIHLGIRSRAFPGCQVLIAKDNDIIFHRAYGYHTYDSIQQVSLHDLYDLASITKVSTSLPAIMKLYEEKKLVLDAGLGEYLPQFNRSNKADLTLRNLLTHQARLKAWIPFWTLTKDKGEFKWKFWRSSPTKNFQTPITSTLFLSDKFKGFLYKQIQQSPLNAESGMVYSDLSFYTYPLLVERLTGITFARYLEDAFYKRLGASRLLFNPLEKFPLHEIVPTERDTFFRMMQIHGVVHDEGAAMLSGISGHAGLFGNALDLAKLMTMYMNKGNYGGETYLQPETLEEFTRYQFLEQGNHRALGFDKPLPVYDPSKSYTAQDASASSFGHSGFTGTFAWADPDHNFLFIFLSNRVYPTRLNRKLYELGLRPAMHQSIYNLF